MLHTPLKVIYPYHNSKSSFERDQHLCRRHKVDAFFIDPSVWHEEAWVDPNEFTDLYQLEEAIVIRSSSAEVKAQWRSLADKNRHFVAILPQVGSKFPLDAMALAYNIADSWGDMSIVCSTNFHRLRQAVELIYTDDVDDPPKIYNSFEELLKHKAYA